MLLSLLFSIRVWEYPNKQNTRSALIAKRVFLRKGYPFPMLATFLFLPRFLYTVVDVFAARVGE